MFKWYIVTGRLRELLMLHLDEYRLKENIATFIDMTFAKKTLIARRDCYDDEDYKRFYDKVYCFEGERFQGLHYDNRDIYNRIIDEIIDDYAQKVETDKSGRLLYNRYLLNLSINNILFGYSHVTGASAAFSTKDFSVPVLAYAPGFVYLLISISSISIIVFLAVISYSIFNFINPTPLRDYGFFEKIALIPVDILFFRTILIPLFYKEKNGIVRTVKTTLKAFCEFFALSCILLYLFR